MARKKHHSSERRHNEMRESGMISENKSAIANMPQEVMYKPYPRVYDELDHGQDDTMRGIDRQLNEDHSVAKRHNKQSKW